MRTTVESFPPSSRSSEPEPTIAAQAGAASATRVPRPTVFDVDLDRAVRARQKRQYDWLVVTVI